MAGVRVTICGVNTKDLPLLSGRSQDALFNGFQKICQLEERPQTFAELGVPGPLVRVLAADGKKTVMDQQTLRTDPSASDGTGRFFQYTRPHATRRKA